MNYAKKGPDSDVTVETDGARWYCRECWMLFDPEQDYERDVTRDSAADMVEHLTDEHIQMGGHKVPVGALALLRADR